MKKLTLILIATIFVSCSGKRGYEKYKRNHNIDYAKDCLIDFPAQTKFIEGKTTIITKDSLIKGDSIPCPKQQNDKEITKTVYVTCPDVKAAIKYITRVDTVSIQDGRILAINKDLTIVNQTQANKIKDLKSDKLCLIIYSIISSIGLILLVLAWFKK